MWIERAGDFLANCVPVEWRGLAAFEAFQGELLESCGIKRCVGLVPQNQRRHVVLSTVVAGLLGLLKH